MVFGFIKKQSLRRKMFLLMTAIALMFAILTSLMISSNINNRDELNEMIHVQIEKVRIAEDILLYDSLLTSSVQEFLLNPKDASIIDTYLGYADELDLRIAQAKNLATPEELLLFSEVDRVNIELIILEDWMFATAEENLQEIEIVLNGPYTANKTIYASYLNDFYAWVESESTAEKLASQSVEELQISFELMQLAGNIMQLDAELTGSLYSILYNPEETKYVDNYFTAADELDANIARALTLTSGNSYVQGLFIGVDTANVHLIAMEEYLIETSQINQNEILNVFTGDYADYKAEFREPIETFFEMSQQQLDDISNSFENRIQQNLTTALVLIVPIIITIMVSILMLNGISSKIAEVLKTTQSLQKSGGNDQAKYNGKTTNDELVLLDNSIESIQEAEKVTKELVVKIADTSRILSTTSEDLLSGAEEINASAEEVASTSQAMSNGATSQTELISDVNLDINETSRMVEDIIKKIQKNTEEVSQIALQTNILALNAGIEASRAGDYGRGFAVVAENVRKLSDQSKEAAEQIAAVANEIAEKLQNSFEKISTSMVNIVSVSEETAASAEEVAAAAEEMTATIEELSSSANELASQAESSQKMIEHFEHN